ncbi:MAG: hypothetical protein P9M12_04330 [Candidatus Aceula lacicola]|nr:hypothetical protein [Candidatus Aceula lacicola]
MKFIGFLIVVCVLVFALIGNSFSAVIELKSGRVVSGAILNQTDKSVKVLLKSGNKVTYYVDEIRRIRTAGEAAQTESKSARESTKFRNKRKQDTTFSYADIEKTCEQFFSKENIESLKTFLCEKFAFISEKTKSFKFAKLNDNNVKKKKIMGIEESIEKAVKKNLEKIDAKIGKIFDSYSK